MNESRRKVADGTLAERALEVRAQAWAPYSTFRVGAALLDDQGRVHVGCNVENAAYPLGTCAEAAAIAGMVAAGGRVIRAIAIAGGSDAVATCMPCGGCRQRIHEFADGDTRVLVLDSEKAWRSWALHDLLPAAFGPG